MADLKLDPIEVTDNPFDFNIEEEEEIQGQSGKGVVFDRPGKTVVGEDSPFAFNVDEEEEVFADDIKVSGFDRFFFNTLRNFPGSAVDVAKSYVEPILHPVQTYENAKAVVNGFGELKEYKAQLKENPKLNLPVTDNMRAAMAVSDYFAQRYGDVVGEKKDSWDVVGKKILRTIENDPAGFMADMTIFLQGPGAILKGGGAVTKGLGNVTGSQTIRNLGTQMGAQGTTLSNIGQKVEPLTASNKVLQMGVKPITDFVNPKGTYDAIKKSFVYGRQGGEANKNFKDAMRGKITEADIMAEINQGASKYKSKLQTDFNTFEQSVSGTKGNFKLMNELKKSIDKMEQDLYIKGSEKIEVGTGVINPKTKKEIVKTEYQTTKRVNPDADKVDLDALDSMQNIYEKYNTVDGLDGKNILRMKQQLQEVQTPRYKNILKTLDSTAKSDLKTINNNTDTVFASYSKMKKDLDKLKQAIGSPDRELTQISKIGQAIKDTPRGNQAMRSIDEIAQSMGTDYLPQLYGANLQSGLSTRGILPSLILGGGAGFLSGDLVNAALIGTGAVTGSSPRFLGEVSNLAGRGTKYLPSSTLPIGMPTTRGINLLGNEQFPIDNTQVIDYKINPNLFDPDFLSR